VDESIFMNMNYQEHVLNDFLSKIEDPRRLEIVQYPLQEVLFLLICAIVSNCNTTCEVAVFGEEKLSWLRKYYPFAKGTPSHDTIDRVLSLIKAKDFERMFVEWVSAVFDINEEELIAIDGKRLAGSANKMDQFKKRSASGKCSELVVNIFATGAGISLGQANVSSKMDEVVGAKQLLEMLDLEGCCISGDANFFRTGFIELILERKANYLITLKKNQRTLYEESEVIFTEKVSKITTS